MIIQLPFAAFLSPALVLLASCSGETLGDSQANAATSPPSVAGQNIRQVGPFTVEELAQFKEPWAAAFQPKTGRLFITEKGGAIKFYDPASGKNGTVTGAPQVDYGGQGGLGDIAFAPDHGETGQIYLSWVEAGEEDTRGAVLGRGMLSCGTNIASVSDTPIASGNSATADGPCTIVGLKVIWRQAPKVTGKGHYSHRIAFSPDGKHLFLASGDRQKMAPAQDTTNNLGTIVRLNLDGTPAAGNPLADQSAPANQIWSYGHRNILGLAFDANEQLWEVEHGPRGGDELNLVKPGQNYGWPLVSDGKHYNGKEIPANASRPDLQAPALGWTPVIAPGDMIFYRGDAFPQWRGQALITGLSTQSLVRIEVDGESAKEAGRYEFSERLRAIDEAPDGSLYVLEDGEEGKLLKLTPAN